MIGGDGNPKIQALITDSSRFGQYCAFEYIPTTGEDYKGVSDPSR